MIFSFMCAKIQKRSEKMNISLQIKYSEASNNQYLAFLKECGYDGVELLLDGELSDVKAVQENIQAVGLTVFQTQLEKDNIEKGLYVSSLMGVKWACLPVEINYDTDLVRASIPFAEKYGVGIALENPVTHDDITETFCIYADSFKSEYVGVCYNIGHANLMGSDDFGIKRCEIDKADAVRKLGERIKIIHANDNHGDADRKLCPTVPNAVCSVNWTDILGALDGIGFDGAFSLVIPIDFGKYNLSDDYIRFTANVSKILLGRGEAK